MAGSVIRTFFGQSLGLQGLGYAPLPSPEVDPYRRVHLDDP